LPQVGVGMVDRKREHVALQSLLARGRAKAMRLCVHTSPFHPTNRHELTFGVWKGRIDNTISVQSGLLHWDLRLVQGVVHDIP